jgi:hypothetical protein
MGRMEGGLNSLVGKLQAFGSLLIGGAVAQGIRSFVHDLEQTGSELNDSSERLGLSTDALQEWRFAAGQSGVGAQQLDAAFARLTLSAEAASQGSARHAKALQALGVNYRDAQGDILPIGDLLPQLVAGFSSIEDQGEKSALAVALFGRAGQRLLPILSGGTEGLAELQAQFQELGGGMSAEAVKAADDYGDAIGRFDVAVLSAKSAIGVQFLPALGRLADWVGRAAGAIGKLISQSHILEAVAVVAGAAMAKWAAALVVAHAPLLLDALLVAGLVLAVEEMIALFSGEGTSSIETLVDELFGMGTAAEFVEKTVNSVRLAWASLTDLVKGTDTYDTILNELAMARQKGTGGALFGEELTHEQKIQRKYGGRNENEVERAKATQSGDVAAYVAARPADQTREQAFESFKAERKAAVVSGQVVGTKEEMAAFAPEIQQAKRPAAALPGSARLPSPSPARMDTPAKGQGRTVTVGPTTLSITASQGTDLGKVEQMAKRLIREHSETQARQISAALGEEG